MLGQFVLGSLSDRLGRRKTMMISVAIFGAFTIATAWATDWWMLLALRFVTGFGLGGAPPNMIACAAEFSPSRRSEEHTSELQSLMRISYAVFCLKKKKYQTKQN